MKTFLLINVKSRTRGYVALLSVIAIGVIGTAIMLSVMLQGINITKTNIAVEKAGQARVLASSCGEEALQKILETGTTSSSGNLTVASGTCSYTISATTSQMLIVLSTGLVDTIVSKIKIIVSTTTPSIVLSSWQEVGDF